MDTVKIKADAKNLIEKIKSFDQTFHKKNGKLISEHYKSKGDTSIPFDFYIGVDYSHQVLTIEFSSKILKERYPELIHKDNFRYCLQRINELQVCRIDVDGIIESGFFVSMDATADVVFDLTEEALNSFNACVNNYRRYKWTHYEKCGIRFSADVKDRRNLDSLVIYNKSKELTKAQNAHFLNTLTNKEQIINYFSDKTRVECTLSCKDKIMSYLDTEDTNISTILNSPINPLLIIINTIFLEQSDLGITQIETMEQRVILSLVKEYNENIKLIEQEARKYYACPKAKKAFMNKVNVILDIWDNKRNYNPINKLKTLISNAD